MSFHHPHRNQGARLNQQARSAKNLAAKTGLFASLRAASLRADGSGAPSPSMFGFALSRPTSPEISLGRSALRRLFAPFALAIVALLALAASASAATARPFESQITEADGTAFVEPTGLAVDNSDDLWDTDAGPNSVDKFDPLGASA